MDYVGDASRVGKTLGNDIRQGYYTLPLLYALKHNDDRLNELLASETYTDEVVSRIIERVNELGGVKQAQELAHKYTVKSLKEIKSLPAGQARDHLEWVTNQLLARQH